MTSDSGLYITHTHFKRVGTHLISLTHSLALPIDRPRDARACVVTTTSSRLSRLGSRGACDYKIDKRAALCVACLVLVVEARLLLYRVCAPTKP